MRKMLISLVLLLIATPAYAASTTIILSGSDTISFHNVTSEATAAYNFLSNNGAGAVLVVNDFGAGAGYGGGGFGPFTSTNTLVGQTLGNFAGIMFASPSTCCSDPGGFAVGHEADLAAFVAAHGNLYVEDYLGGGAFAATWNSILGFDGLPGVRADTGCTGDPGTATAQGATFGYVGGSFGCYTHQIYDPAFFAPLGFVSLVDGCDTVSGNGTICGSVILGSGEAAVGVTPEPATLVLFGTGLVTVLVRSRKALKRTQ
jgi:PEP-CTERM motif-containing protein